jgi:DNA invertase Pin-like site-specific DNA recombinase
MKRVAIYLRVSTSKQDTDNQLRELTAVADRSGWEIWKVYEDASIVNEGLIRGVSCFRGNSAICW